LENLSLESAELSPNHLYGFMWFSETVELSEVKIKERLQTLAVDEAVLIKRPRLGVQAGVFRMGEKVFVVFRGTRDAADYFDNAFVFPTPAQEAGLPGKVHTGFRKNFLAIWEDVRSAALRLGAERHGAWVMGHSLGGALAQFAAFNFVQQGVAVHGVFGSGVPLPGDSEYQRLYNEVLGEKTTVVGYENDITPNVPPMAEAASAFAAAAAAPLKGVVLNLAQNMDYKQVGRWFHMSKEGTISHVEDLGAHQNNYYLKMRRDNATVGLPGVLLKDMRYVKDHYATVYLCAMREVVSRVP
jgi:pimeloyl-ACP methyl ester carboxylesterase